MKKVEDIDRVALSCIGNRGKRRTSIYSDKRFHMIMDSVKDSRSRKLELTVKVPIKGLYDVDKEVMNIK